MISSPAALLLQAFLPRPLEDQDPSSKPAVQWHLPQRLGKGPSEDAWRAQMIFFRLGIGKSLFLWGESRFEKISDLAGE